MPFPDFATRHALLSGRHALDICYGTETEIARRDNPLRASGMLCVQVMSTQQRVMSESGAAPSIAIVDDHRLFLNGLVMMIENAAGSRDVSSYECPFDLIADLDGGKRFDLVICDLIMSRMNGLAFVDAIRRSHRVPVLMLSGTNTAPPIHEMRKLGVVGFVHKSADDEVLFGAIESALVGKACFPEDEPCARDAASDGDYGRQVEFAGDTGSIPNLSPRQMEVLQLLAGGASNGEIARNLGISENTVKTHLKVIFDALRVTKRTACVQAAHALGVI